MEGENYGDGRGELRRWKGRTTEMEGENYRDGRGEKDIEREKWNIKGPK